MAKRYRNLPQNPINFAPLQKPTKYQIRVIVG